MSVPGIPPTPEPAVRFRAFYDWPEPVEFECFVPGDVQGPEETGEYLFEHAPIVEARAVRVEPADLPALVAAAEPATPPESASARGGVGEAHSANETVFVPDGDRVAQIEDLARVLDGPAFADPGEPEDAEARLDRGDRQLRAKVQADRALVAGFRRVAEDPETIERLRRALWERSWRHAPSMATEENWQWASKQIDWDGQPAYDGVVRALLAALRGGEQK